MKRKCPKCNVTTYDTTKDFKCAKCGWENKIGWKNWHLLNKESTPKGAKIYINNEDANVWIGIRKFEDGWQVSSSSGLQPNKFKSKIKAMEYLTDWIRE